ncbi:MAG: hypothetical protein ACJ8G3_21160 [Burkholderiaceae bacterium]
MDIGPSVLSDDVVAANRVAAGALADVVGRKGTSGMALPTLTIPASAGVGLGSSIFVEAPLSVESLAPPEQAASTKTALADASVRRAWYFMQFSSGNPRVIRSFCGWRLLCTIRL